MDSLKLESVSTFYSSGESGFDSIFSDRMAGATSEINALKEAFNRGMLLTVFRFINDTHS